MPDTWSFYLHSQAFPTLPLPQRHLEDIQMGLDAEGGGSLGEWRVSWIDLGGRFEQARPAIHLDIFGDGWAAFARSGLTELMGRLMPTPTSPAPTVEQFVKALLEAGWHDRTDELHVVTEDERPGISRDHAQLAALIRRYPDKTIELLRRLDP